MESQSVGEGVADVISWITSFQLTNTTLDAGSLSIFATTTRTARISDSGRERQTAELAPSPQVRSFLVCDWSGCTTVTIGGPNSHQRSVVKTSGFLGTDSCRPRVKGEPEW